MSSTTKSRGSLNDGNVALAYAVKVAESGAMKRIDRWLADRNGFAGVETTSAPIVVREFGAR